MGTSHTPFDNVQARLALLKKKTQRRVFSANENQAIERQNRMDFKTIEGPFAAISQMAYVQQQAQYPPATEMDHRQGRLPSVDIPQLSSSKVKVDDPVFPSATKVGRDIKLRVSIDPRVQYEPAQLACPRGQAQVVVKQSRITESSALSSVSAALSRVNLDTTIDPDIFLDNLSALAGLTPAGLHPAVGRASIFHGSVGLPSARISTGKRANNVSSATTFRSGQRGVAELVNRGIIPGERAPGTVVTNLIRTSSGTPARKLDGKSFFYDLEDATASTGIHTVNKHTHTGSTSSYQSVQHFQPLLEVSTYAE
jgi:hypothetical protein